MTWKLFIDDERMPGKDAQDYEIARSSAAAVGLCWQKQELPVAIAFDHDLGGEDTSMVFLNWMLESIMDCKYELPADFTFTVHSQNPIGAALIRDKLTSFIRDFLCREGW